MTLVYRPPLNRNFPTEFVRVNVDAHLGQEEGNTYKNRTKQAHLPGEGAEANFEYKLIEYGLKWWPIKSYEARFPKERAGPPCKWFFGKQFYCDNLLPSVDATDFRGGSGYSNTFDTGGVCPVCISGMRRSAFLAADVVHSGWHAD